MQPRILLVATLVAALGSRAVAQDRFATSVVSFNQGGGGGLFDTEALLGGPRGAGLATGSLDVLTLGTGGDVTVGFDVTITNGPGADFTVYENGFALSGSNGIFAEFAYVEVSTNGVDFARFSSVPLPDPAVWGAGAGLAGGTPCMANVLTNSIDPFDPVESGGDSFDLAELTQDSLVLAGLVDLSQIHYVRLVNASLSGADFDAVAVIQYLGNQSAGAPTCDLWRDEAGYLHLRAQDPNGLADIDFSRFRVSFNLNSVALNRLRLFMTLLSQSSTELHLVSSQPIALYGFEAMLGVSLEDRSGNFSGDQIALNP